MESTQLLWARLILILNLILTASACADGKFVTPHLLRPPEIPSQSAAISFYSGQQVLTVWNTVQTEAAEAAWVLPLPAPPDIIQQSSPDAFRLLEALCAPKVDNRVSFPAGMGYLVGAFCLVAGLIFLRRRRSASGVTNVAPALFGMGLIIVLLITLSYALIGVPLASFHSAAARGSVAGVRELSSQEAGVYETTVLSATGSGPLNEWLKNAGFPQFTGNELAVVDDYAAKGWVFLCARIPMGDGSSPKAPHPLSVRFDAKDVVYPMRLTAGSGPAVHVRLFVLARRTWHDPTGRLATVSDDSLDWRLRKRLIHPDLISFKKYHTWIRENGSTNPPEDLLYHTLSTPPWRDEGDLTLSLMTGTFRPDSDWSDIVLQQKSYHSSPARHVPEKSLINERETLALLLAGPLFLVLSIVPWSRAKADRGQDGWKRTVLIMAIPCSLFAAIRFLPWNEKGIVVVPAESVQQGRDSAAGAAAIHERWTDSVISRMPVPLE